MATAILSRQETVVRRSNRRTHRVNLGSENVRSFPVVSRQSGLSSRMEITSPNPLTDPQWDGHVEKFANGTFFHTSAWARVLTKTYGHVPSYISGSVDRKCVALLPMLEVRSPWTGRRGVCLPFTDACSTLAIDSATAEAVTAHAFQLARERGWKHVEFRGGIKPSPTATPSVSFLSHSLDLRDGPAVVLSRFDSAVRRAIRKAERSNL